MPKSVKKRSATKAPQPQQQQQPSSSSATSLPSPATTVNNGPQPPVPIIPTFDFTFFLQHASSADLERFLELASTTQEGRNLRLLWRWAFAEGVEQGTDKANFATDLQLSNANLDGFQDGYEQGREEVAEEIIQGYEKRIEKALYDEWSTWKGHGDNCFKLPISPSTREFAVQSDPICLPPATSALTCEVAIQSEPIHFPPTASSSTQTPMTPPASTATEKISWADDVATLPSSFIPSTAPRDLSCLRSERIHPFGALRQRDRCTRRQPQNHRNRNTYIFSYPKSRSVSIPPISPFTIPRKPPHLSPSCFSPSPPLNWEDDPRLSALSHALRALGWNRGVS